MQNTSQNPCFGCTKRTTFCHGKCLEYQEFWQQTCKEREKRQKEAYINHVCHPKESDHYRDGWMMRRPYCQQNHR